MTGKVAVIPDRIHIVGIGGAGMSAIAEYLVSMNRQVTGSDLHDSPQLHHLASMGVRIFQNHFATNADADLVVTSDAIPVDNVEIAHARSNGLTVLRRAECVALLGGEKKRIYVAGSHGKTTTAAMIAQVVESAAGSPSFVIGANVPGLGNRRGRLGDGSLYVAEACEAFQNLAYFHSDVAVITNIDDEHIEHYRTQLQLDAAFRDFAQRAATKIAYGDDPGVRRVLSEFNGRLTTFGFNPDNYLRAERCEFNIGGSAFDLWIAGQFEGRVHVAIPGRHVVLNALACIQACRSAGIAFEDIAEGLGAFKGASRRWEDHGVADGIRVIDDYAHHPAELKAIIHTARSVLCKDERLAIAFQPQLFSRTVRLKKELAAILSQCDQVFLLEIDPGGEKDTKLVRSGLLADEIAKQGGTVELCEDIAELVARAPKELVRPSMLLVVGAGSVREAAPRLVQAIKTRALRQVHRAFAERSQPSRRWGEAIAYAFGRNGEKPDSVRALFMRRVRFKPNECAVSDSGSAMSYRELDVASDNLAGAFALRGVASGNVVGVALPFSIDLVVTAVALMKIGAVYLPLDDALPAERVTCMLTQSAAHLFIVSRDSKLDKTLLRAAAQKIYIDELAGGRAQTEGIVSHYLPTPETDPERGFYICFTSGSTGYPKGVLIRQQQLFALLPDIISRFGVSSRTKTALNISISFDVSLAEIWLTLCGGGELVASGTLKPLVGERLAKFIKAREITHLLTTPSVLGSIVAQALPKLKCIVCIGEVCSQELVDRWARGRRFFNAYGPTEATIFATAAKCRIGKKVTIGRALEHVNTYILDQNQEAVAAGEVGELCLGGVGAARGYLGLEKESQDKFRKWRPNERECDWIYRTGDLVRKDRSGDLCFLGRLDQQVKILGNRIELEEIEESVKRLPNIVGAAVCVDEKASKELICFVVTKNGRIIDQAEARESLARWLPSYMLPSHIVRVETIPLTTTGKKDRRALLAGFERTIVRRHAQYEQPRNEVERKITTIWQEILEAETGLGMYDDFASFGGDSLRTLLVIARVEEAFQIAVPPGLFGGFTTIARMAVQLADLLWDESKEYGAAASIFQSGRIYKQLRDLTAVWTGVRTSDTSLIVSMGAKKPKCDFFVCVQAHEELQGLAEHLGEGFRVHGMRSGHLVMDYNPENIEALASHYLEELEAIAPRGPMLIGGICQGGIIAHALAKRLLAMGQAIGPLVQIEHGRLLQYEGEVAFIYAEESYLNPLKRGESALPEYERFYGDRFTIETIPGVHGSALCLSPNGHFLADKIRAASLRAPDVSSA